MRDAINIFLLGLRVADTEDWIPYGGNEELCVNMNVMLTDYDFQRQFHSYSDCTSILLIKLASNHDWLRHSTFVVSTFGQNYTQMMIEIVTEREREEITTFVPNFLCKRLRFWSIEFAWNFRWWAKVEHRNFIESFSFTWDNNVNCHGNLCEFST